MLLVESISLKVFMLGKQLITLKGQPLENGSILLGNKKPPQNELREHVYSGRKLQENYLSWLES